MLTGSLAESNFLGRGYALNLSADFSTRSQRYYLQFRDDFFMGSNYSFGGSLFQTSVRFDDFEQDRTGLQVSLGHTLSDDHATRGLISYQLSRRDIDQNSNTDSSAVIHREILGGESTSSAVAVQLSTDRRNDRIVPTSGYQATGFLEFAGLGGFSRHIKAEGKASYYMPVPDWLLRQSTFAFRLGMGYVLPLNELDDYTWNIPTDAYGLYQGPDSDLTDTPLSQVRSLDLIDEDHTLPLSERYFLGGMQSYQLRGFEGRSVGPRSIKVRRYANIKYSENAEVEPGTLFAPVGVDPRTGKCLSREEDFGQYGGDRDGICNTIDDPIRDVDETDVIGGSKFITTSVEYRFPISDTLGLQGLFFLDAGNAFGEKENMFDLTEWRFGTGAGVLWFSPFGPLALVLGFPLDPYSYEKKRVFEFSVGGQSF
jgi:outer membrane protein assembly complex protein YaeT